MRVSRTCSAFSAWPSRLRASPYCSRTRVARASGCGICSTSATMSGQASRSRKDSSRSTSTPDSWLPMSPSSSRISRTASTPRCLVEVIGKTAYRPKVEREPAAAGEDQDRAPGAHGVTDAELIIDVGVSSSEMGYGVIAWEEPLEYMLLNNAADLFFIRPDRLEACRLNRGP